MASDLPIGVFDSGVGGLTVLRALRARLPRHSFCYLGDTARLPYGTKSPETVERYAIQASRILVERGVQMLVVACNTASSVALPALEKEFPGVPVIGVVKPGAEAAAATSVTGRIGVLATESTARTAAYDHAILRARPDAVVATRACSVFVALAEEGWNDGDAAEAVARRYVRPLLDEHSPDCLLLGCTHFPLLRDTIAKVAGPDVHLVDSAETTAAAVAALLEGIPAPTSPATLEFLATDSGDRFLATAARFLPASISPRHVEIVDLA